MNGLLEILTTKKWMMAPTHLTAIRQALVKNLSAHAAFSAEKKVMGRVFNSEGDMVKSFCIGEDGDYVGSSWYADEIKMPFVNVLDVNGPITRNGGGCSYGSVGHRDMMLMAADNPNCRGHVFVINTPGGSAWAKNDYQQAIEYARAKGQPVIAFVDGLCASAGMYLAALCDERYYMHPQDEIGCIGVMAAFYTEKDGGHNEFTNETYHELYDPESFEKNKSFRDIANDDDASMFINELATLGREFRADVKQACPTATKAHLHGRIFAAKDVKGILMDGQSTLGNVIARVFGLADGSLQAITRPEPTKEEEEADEKKESATTQGSEGPETPLGSATSPDNQKKSEIINQAIMDAKYNNLAAACGVEELVITEEGTHLDISLVDALNEKLTADNAALASANEQVSNLQQQLDDMKEANEKAVADREAEIRAEHEKAVEDIKAEHASAMDALKAEHATALNEATNAKETAEKELAGAKEALAAAEQKIADRDAQIKALTEAPAAETEESPANNGSGVETQGINTMPAYNANLSPEENQRIRAEWKKKNNA